MRRRLLLLAALLVVAWGAYVAYTLLAVASDLRAGRDAASAARDQLGAEEVADGEPLPELREAAERFDDADHGIGSLAMAPLRLLPVVGRQVRSVDALAGAAATVAEAGADAIERAQIVLEDPAGGGEARLEQAIALRDIVGDVADRLGEIDDLGPLDGLIAPLADARNELAADLLEAQQSVDDARTGADAIVSLVGGPRRYLVIAANNAEMRAGSGMWLQGGVLETSRGDLELGEMRPLALDADPPDDAVPITGDLADRWGFLHPQREWRNLMLSPRFPASAELAVAMWRAATGEEVDGVLVVDAIGLQALVEATGPVEVDGRQIAAEDVARELLHDQYVGVELGVDAEVDAERRETLARIADAAIERVDAGGWDTSTMLRSLAEAVRGRHLLGWSRDAVEQAGWEAAGMAGDVGPDDLLVALLNRGANKLDWFLDVDAVLDIEPVDDGWAVTVEVTMTNTTPDGEPGYVAGPRPELGLDYGVYRGILAASVPGAARDVRFEGVPGLAVAGRDGPTWVVAFQLEVAPAERRSHVLRFTLPKSAKTSLRVVSSAREPEIAWSYVAEGWEDSEARTVNW